MNPQAIEQLLRQVQIGESSVEGALEALKSLPYEDTGFAKVDHHRALRRGVSEVVFGEGKTGEQIGELMRRLYQGHGRALATRVPEEVGRTLVEELGDPFRYESQSRVLKAEAEFAAQEGLVVVACAGTSDLPVAREACEVLAFLGSKSDLLVDIGVSGLHRLLGQLERLRAARVVIVVAGMEGALCSVVGGLVACPVIGVPTSVGYGTSFGGVAALLAMLNSCSSGVTVVNIDNGFGAAYSAHLINVGAGP